MHSIEKARRLTRTLSPRVLLIDADLDLLGEMCAAFSAAGCLVDMAADSDEGLWLFEQTSPDLVLVDLGAPAQPGLDVIVRIKRLRPAAKVIATCAGYQSSPENELMIARYVGADETLAKPFAMESLIALATRALSAA
jgi:DNA-binding response OmpR family regulator